jgi:elongator complex protein 3
MKIEEIVIEKLIESGARTSKGLEQIKREVSQEFRVPFLSNSQLLKAYHNLVKLKRIAPDSKIEELLRIRRVRSLSGIVIVSVLTKPYPCPGKCLYCPAQAGVPKSYLKDEPAVMRAITFQYHPYSQVQARLKALKETGHPIDKIDLRIIGGTWSYYPKNYQTWFIKNCFAACNAKLAQKKKGKTIRKIGSLEELQRKNEKAKHRIIGITIETRPDFINEKEIKRLRYLGVTRVELGVQSIYDDVLKLNIRGHDVETTALATKLLKDAGFKICYQMMPNLPGSNFKKDIEMFRKLFSNPDFCPDYLKIYPCALLKEAPLYKLWKKGKYQPYTTEELIKLLIRIKKLVPYYCRIQRIVRDIPSDYIVEGGTKISNLRQMIAQISKKQGWRCKCIRCREVRENYDPKEKVYLFRDDYEASGGKEIFLSFENKNRTKLYSLLRLRISSQCFEKKQHFISVLNNASIIRELHTYGKLVPIKTKKRAPQHRGLGKKLMKEAEKITKKEFGLKKIAVISGVGVRDYYRKLGYRLEDTYMIKWLKN